jgi:hypothetical protein
MKRLRVDCTVVIVTLFAVNVDASGQDAPKLPLFADTVRVLMGDDELPLADVVRRAAADERLVAYRQLRVPHGGTAAGQLELARWCRRQGLEDEEQLHWRILHYMRPGHQEATKALGLKNYQGAWLRKDEIAQIKTEKKLVHETERKWTSRLKQLRRSIEHGDAAEREQALGELDSIRDPLAMPVVEKIFADAVGEVGLLIVEMFARVAKPTSTAGLVRLAVRSPDAAVRKKAAGELRYHPVEEYAPLLIAGLEAPIELSSYVAVEKGGPTFEWYSQRESTGRLVPGLYGVIRLSGNYTSRDVLFWTVESKPISGWRLTGHRPDRIQYQYVLSRDSPEPDAPYEYTGLIEAASNREESLHKEIAALKEKINDANAATAELNEHIHAALTEATGTDAAGGEIHPRVWWDWWRKRLNLNNYFAEGTEVWTQTGPLPIEQVLVGDRVITRDPKSEELRFQLVIGCDRKLQDTVHVLEVKSRAIVATAEQPFYVADEGWRRADQLKPGLKLQTLAGPKRIENVVPGLGASTYSLLVDKVPNYFVDRQGILVHDATRH